MESLENLIYDWNTADEKPRRPSNRKIEFDDETLRDGLQSPSVTDPALEEKVQILHFMNDIGVDLAQHPSKFREFHPRELLPLLLT